MKPLPRTLLLPVVAFALLMTSGCANEQPKTATAGVYDIQEQYVDANGELIYVKSFGQGEPLVVVHGGPGASHEYLLPYLTPLARKNRLVFIDERGSGKSQKLEDPKGYTVENMVEDVEGVRTALGLGKINLLGHSYGGVLAQAYAFKYPANLQHLVLCSTFHSTQALNAVFVKMKAEMPADLRARIDKAEKTGLFGQGHEWEKNRYPASYMTDSWGGGYFSHLYQNHPDANYDPVANGIMSWDLYREMWGSHGEFVIDGNLANVEYADKLKTLQVPTLITVGDHDEVDPSIARDMNTLIPGSKLVVFPQSGHMTFVDQPGLFVSAVNDFLHGAAK